MFWEKAARSLFASALSEATHGSVFAVDVTGHALLPLQVLEGTCNFLFCECGDTKDSAFECTGGAFAPFDEILNRAFHVTRHDHMCSGGGGTHGQGGDFLGVAAITHFQHHVTMVAAEVLDRDGGKDANDGDHGQNFHDAEGVESGRGFGGGQGVQSRES